MRICYTLLSAPLLSPVYLLSQSAPPVASATHEARFDAQGRPLPWTTWNTALEVRGKRHDE